MSLQNIPFLCGGIFFNLLLQTRKPRTKARSKQKYGTDGLSAPEVMKGLVYVITGNELSKNGDFSKSTSEFRTCKINSSTYIPFEDNVITAFFNDAVTKKDPDTQKRMSEFIDAFVNPALLEWLAKSLIETIYNDKGISNETEFLISQTASLSVDKLVKVKNIEIEIFLLSIMKYIFSNRINNTLGIETFKAWFDRKSERSEWKFTNSEIGNSIQQNIDISRFVDINNYDENAELTEDFSDKIAIINGTDGKAPDLSLFNDGNIFIMDKDILDDRTEQTPLTKYLKAAAAYYSTKKTLLYAERPHPFYDLYVCNDLKYSKTRTHDFKEESIISDVTIEKLDTESKYVIIQGTGGIGKSMLLTHLFLSSAQNSETSGIIPLFLSLKNYKDTTDNVVDFIWKSVCEYDSAISRKAIIEALQNKELVLLLDGYDEIQSSARESFQSDLEAFIKSYNGNTIIMTSRPIYDSFVSFSKFSVFDIKPLTKPQALELVGKLEFWDDIAKTNFMKALDSQLYSSHWEFASNPLLLTIMLMTYSAFGEVPAKMHVFYSKAYETMARLHDASKGSFKRPLHTNLTPEEFSKYFAEFCARTYRDEMLEFDERSFTAYMAKVLRESTAESKGVTPHDFLLDLTDNLCIMYREGSTYYFIHRSFQEYFAAVHFSSEYDAKLTRIGNFFEGMKNRNYTDKTFDMMYDMISDKVERFIFLPFLEKLLTGYSQKGKDEYWEFLENQYPFLNYEEGEVGDSYLLSPQSFLYKAIIKFKNMDYAFDIDSVEWPSQIYDLPTQNWVRVYSEFAEDDGFLKYPDPADIDESVLDDTTLIPEEQLPYQYDRYFGSPDSTGLIIEIEIYELRKYAYKYRELRECMEDTDFPLMREFLEVKEYYKKLKEKTEKEEDSDDLFDD